MNVITHPICCPPSQVVKFIMHCLVFILMIKCIQYQLHLAYWLLSWTYSIAMTVHMYVFARVKHVVTGSDDEFIMSTVGSMEFLLQLYMYWLSCCENDPLGMYLICCGSCVAFLQVCKMCKLSYCCLECDFIAFC